MKKTIVYLIFFLFLFSCKNKKPDSTKAYFSVVDFINSQIKQIDSLPLHFTKMVIIDGAKTDTIQTTKEEFKFLSKEFTSIPDISSQSNMDDYKETSDYDETLGNVLLIYAPKKENEEVQNETIIMQPDEQGNTHVKTIFIKTIQSEKDATIEKNLTWHINNHFQIVTKTDKSNQPEKVNTTIIKWE